MRKKYEEPMMQFFVLSGMDMLTASTSDFREQDIHLDNIFQS